jgi:Zn-dependent alcohol dehydrogenase
MKMKAAILEKLNSPLIVDDLEIPDLDYGQVLVKVCRSGICGAQVDEISGRKGEDKYLPHLLGHEGGGVIEDIGPGVTLVKRGDHVVMHWRRGDGIESNPPKYRRNDGSIVGAGWVTTFNEYAIVSENRLTPIDDDIPFEIAALMGCAVTTALGLINNEAKLKIGQSIAIIGCGGVGLNIIRGAAMVSANPIISIDQYRPKLRMAEGLGATHLLTSESLLWDDTQRIRNFIGSRDLDVVVDCAGSYRLIANIFKLMSPKGKLILLRPISQLLPGFVDGIEVMNSSGGYTNPNEDIPRYLDLYRKGKLSLDGLITHRFPLSEINIALDVVRSGQAGRIILEIAG